MSRASEAARKAYPPTNSTWKRHSKRVQSERVDTHQPARTIFQKGYEQAEKEFAEIIKTAQDHAYFAGSESMREKVISLINSRISEILGDAQPAPVLRMELQGIIDKIK